MNLLGVYEYKTNDSYNFNDFTLDNIKEELSSTQNIALMTSQTSFVGGQFFTSNKVIYSLDLTTEVFQAPVAPQMVGLVPLETIVPTPVQTKITETLKVIIPIAMMVFSALLSPFLIRWLISRLK